LADCPNPNELCASSQGNSINYPYKTREYSTFNPFSEKFLSIPNFRIAKTGFEV
jgi:hypothetical protein